MPNAKPKSWRDLIKTHPAAALFPMMSPEELIALAEDIKKHGLRNRVVLVNYAPKRADGSIDLADMQECVLDGRNRLDAIERLGWSMFDEDGCLDREYADLVNDTEPDPDTDFDPYAYVLSANVHRRHLTAEQKRELIATVLKAQPEKSNRRIAEQTKVDHKTVATVRAEKEATGEIPQLTKTVGKDGKARKQPKSKPKTIAQPKRKPTAKTPPANPPAPAAHLPLNSGPGTTSEAERLTTRVEELQNEKRLLELKIVGLESEVEELKAQLAAAPAQPQPSMLTIGELRQRASELVGLLPRDERRNEIDRFMSPLGLSTTPIGKPQRRRRATTTATTAQQPSAAAATDDGLGVPDFLRRAPS